MRPRGIVILTEGLWEAREGTAAVRPYLEIMEATVTTEWQAVEAGDGATQSTIKCELLVKNLLLYGIFESSQRGYLCYSRQFCHRGHFFTFPYCCEVKNS